MDVAKSLRCLLSDFWHLCQADVSIWYKIRATLAYAKLVLLYPFQPRKVRALGWKLSYGDYGTFQFMFREIFVRNTYHAHMKKVPVILDCGANIGLTSLYFKTFYPKAAITCFEPLSENLAHLKHNTGQVPGITVIPAALTDKKGTIKLYYDKQNPTAGDTGTLAAGKRPFHKVKTVPLSDYVKKLKPDIVKLDIEGAEGKVLKELAKTKTLGMIGQLIMEYHPSRKNIRFDTTLKLLERHGFRTKVEAEGGSYPMIYATRR